MVKLREPYIDPSPNVSCEILESIKGENFLFQSKDCKLLKDSGPSR